MFVLGIIAAAVTVHLYSINIVLCLAMSFVCVTPCNHWTLKPYIKLKTGHTKAVSHRVHLSFKIWYFDLKRSASLSNHCLG
jgi:hypothetical protein